MPLGLLLLASVAMLVVAARLQEAAAVVAVQQQQHSQPERSLLPGIIFLSPHLAPKPLVCSYF